MRTSVLLLLFLFFSLPSAAKAQQIKETKASPQDSGEDIPGLKTGTIIKKVAPKYPDKARKAGVEGIVHLHVVIAKNGSMLSVEVVSGDPLLVDAAVKAVRKWRYKPSLMNGEPVEIDTTIDVEFTLNKNP